MEIRTYSEEYKSKTKQFILNILEDEFGLTGVSRPDLDKIPEVYQNDKSNFWIAIVNDRVIGTIALKNCGSNRGYLKRMYVDKTFRGKGVAHELISTLKFFAKDNGYHDIFLGTIKALIAANKFYMKEGFQKVDSVPDDMDLYRDTIFYKLNIMRE